MPSTISDHATDWAEASSGKAVNSATDAIKIIFVVDFK
jgi:hypothetical protein